MKYDITHALRKLYPEGAKFVQEGIEYSGLKWVDERPKPTETELNAKVAELQAEYDALQYQRDRAEQYPSYADQFDTIYHQGIDAWKAEIKKVKDANPKPSE